MFGKHGLGAAGEFVRKFLAHRMGEDVPPVRDR